METTLTLQMKPERKEGFILTIKQGGVEIKQDIKLIAEAMELKCLFTAALDMLLDIDTGENEAVSGAFIKGPCPVHCPLPSCKLTG